MHAKYSFWAGLEYFTAGGLGTLAAVESGNPYLGAGVGAAGNVIVDAAGHTGPGGSNILNNSSSGEEWLQSAIKGGTSSIAGYEVTGEVANIRGLFTQDELESIGFRENVMFGETELKTPYGEFKDFSDQWYFQIPFGMSQDYGKNKFNFSQKFSLAGITSSFASNAISFGLGNAIPEIKMQGKKNIYTIVSLAAQNYLRAKVIDGIANYGGDIVASFDDNGNLTGGLFHPNTWKGGQNFINAIVTPFPGFVGIDPNDPKKYHSDVWIDPLTDAEKFLLIIFK